MKFSETNLDDIKTLEEAKQQLSLLLEAQKNAYNFLYLFCNYSLRELVILMRGYTELLQKKDLADKHPSFLETLWGTEQKMFDLIDSIGFLAFDERRKFDHAADRRWNLEPVRLGPLLTRAQVQLQEFANAENRKPFRSLSGNEQVDRRLRKLDPIQTHFNISHDIPSVLANSALLERSFSDVVWFMTQQSESTEFSIQTTFDQEMVKITFGCHTSVPDSYIMREFRRFETAASIFEFDPKLLSLYRNWLHLKFYDAALELDFEENAGTQQPSIVSATINLKRSP